MRKSILTIEDSKALSFVMTTLFKKDFDVFSVNNYFEAFHFLRSKQFVDLIIINISNDESDNFRFLSHLSSSSLFYDVPKIVISGSSDSRLKDKTIACGASLFLNTPFDPVLLSEKAKELIYEKENRQWMKEAQ